MGVVYRATQVSLERPVALKVIAPELASSADFRERFKRESRLAASIEHQNVIPVYEAGEADEVLYLIMRYVEGTDLRALIDAEGALDPGRAVTDRHPGRERPCRRPPPRPRAPRREARQRADRRRGESRPRLPHRLRHRPRGSGHGRPHQDRHGGGHARLHRPGAHPGRRGRRPFRRLRAGLRALRDAHRAGSRSRATATSRRCTRTCPSRPRRRARCARSSPETLAGLVPKAMAKDPDERFATADELAAALTREAETVQPTVAAAPGEPSPAGRAADRARGATHGACRAAAGRPPPAPRPSRPLDRPGRAAGHGRWSAAARPSSRSPWSRRCSSPEAMATRTRSRRPRSVRDAAPPEALDPRALEPVRRRARCGWGRRRRGIRVGREQGTRPAGPARSDGPRDHGHYWTSGGNPDSVAVGLGRVWVTNTDSDTVSMIDPATPAVKATVRVGDQPEGIALGRGSAWVANKGDDTVTRIDADGAPLGTESVGATSRSSSRSTRTLHGSP